MLTKDCCAVSDGSKEVKELLRDEQVARRMREIDASSHPHGALLAARSDPQV